VSSFGVLFVLVIAYWFLLADRNYGSQLYQYARKIYFSFLFLGPLVGEVLFACCFCDLLLIKFYGVLIF